MLGAKLSDYVLRELARSYYDLTTNPGSEGCRNRPSHGLIAYILYLVEQTTWGLSSNAVNTLRGADRPYFDDESVKIVAKNIRYWANEQSIVHNMQQQ